MVEPRGLSSCRLQLPNQLQGLKVSTRTQVSSTQITVLHLFRVNRHCTLCPLQQQAETGHHDQARPDGETNQRAASQPLAPLAPP
mmetsp:Transcript_41808/g.50688  ORF Transcript_41808/g.50688 Transcript_41808/m.50688 type:complete len:85 (-) Transcript_41808:921-1175(-)